jgi:hypothetical protein
LRRGDLETLAYLRHKLADIAAAIVDSHLLLLPPIVQPDPTARRD